MVEVLNGPVGFLGPLVPPTHLDARGEHRVTLKDGGLLGIHRSSLELERALRALAQLIVIVGLLEAQEALREHVSFGDVRHRLVETLHAQPRAANDVVLGAQLRFIGALGDLTVRQDAELLGDAALLGSLQRDGRSPLAVADHGSLRVWNLRGSDRGASASESTRGCALVVFMTPRSPRVRASSRCHAEVRPQ